MEIIIKKTNTKYQITQDKYQFILSKSKKPQEGEEVWENIGYFHTLPDLFFKLIRLNLMDSRSAKTLEEAIFTTCKNLSEAVKSDFL